MSDGDPLLQPFSLRHLRLRNRVISTSHEPAYSEDGMPKERYRLYHLEKARGGLALTMTAGSAIVAEDSSSVFGNLHAYKDEIVPWLRRISDDCHEAGCAVMIQLTHLGRRTRWNQADWLPVVAPSPVREPTHRSFPKVIEDWDLERISLAYADAADRMLSAGLDGIELHASGHLIDQFWSPATNQREDEHGGSLENRLRFTHQVLQAIRERVGSDFIVGLRMVADENWDKGLSLNDGLAIAKTLSDSGLVDFLNVNRGHIETDAALVQMVPTHGMPSAPHLDCAAMVREVTKMPVFHAARINDVATARFAIASGKVDMVGMTRALIADPHLVKKIYDGREHEIRPCVGAAYCIDRIYEGQDALCIHNPATGREATIPHMIQRKAGDYKNIVIVGAGPAGLEAARVSAERGHHVEVFEAAPHAGGQIRLLIRHARRKEMQSIIDWRLERCESRGVKFHFNSWADAAALLDQQPDVVIIATGGVPNTNVVNGSDELVASSWDIISGDVDIADDVLLYDDNGGHPGLQAAEVIAEKGARLEILTPERLFSPEIGGVNYVAYATTFHKCGVTITINKRLLAVQRDGALLKATIGSDYDTRIESRLISQVVVEHGTLPLDDLYVRLRPESINRGEVDYRALMSRQEQRVYRNPKGKYHLYRIGDAVASRNIHAAIFDALRLCISL